MWTLSYKCPHKKINSSKNFLDSLVFLGLHGVFVTIIHYVLLRYLCVKYQNHNVFRFYTRFGIHGLENLESSRYLPISFVVLYL